MANDPYIPVIANLLETYSTTNSLGWNVVQQDSPNRKVWDAPPLVIVTPSQKEVKYLAFQATTATTNKYDCYLCSTGNLASDFDNMAQQFFQACLENFMPANNALHTAGAYSSRINPKYDYDRAAFPQGWSVTCVEVKVMYIN